MELDIFNTQDFTIPAGKSIARFPVSGTILRVFSCKEPIRIGLIGKANTERLVLAPGMGRRFAAGNGFQYIELERISTDTAADLTAVLGYGTGEVFDNRAVADITNNNALSVSLAAQPPVMGRFLPKYTPKHNLAGSKYYKADITAAPTITAGVSSNLNLIARQDLAVTKRVIKLLSGTASLAVSYTETAYPGHVATLSTVGDSITLEGGQWLYGTTSSTATLSVYEVYAGTAADLGDVPADAGQSAANWPAAYLEGSFTLNITGAVSGGALEAMNLLTSGNVNRASQWTGSVAINAIFPTGSSTLSFQGVTAADVATYGSMSDTGKNPVANALSFRAQIITSAPARINCGNGQSFATDTGGGYGSYYRVIFPSDSSAPYMQQRSDASWNWVNAS